MAQRREKKAPPGKERRPIKKKTSILITESVDWIDYKDVNLLRRFMSERAKIRARRVTGNTQQQQVAVARAIRIAREMALLPYSVRQVTQRSKGRRDRDRDRDRGDRDGELRELPGDEVEASEELEATGLDESTVDGEPGDETSSDVVEDRDEDEGDGE
jgi:small subunit ribosomal protein S18